MAWELTFYQEGRNEPVSEFLDAQNAKARAKILRNLLLLEEFGPDLGFPLVSNIGRNIWELRTVFQGNQYRILFSVVAGKILLLLSGFIKKTRKLPDAELKLAEQRLKAYLSNT
ncbi:MAG: type II toxin-antitoxin system RelE/ParE family toxin [Acidobacteriota bacterium]